MGGNLRGLDERQTAILRRLWRRYQGEAWEPMGGTDQPAFKPLIKAGYLCVRDGRCGFEAFKDSMIAWTPAAQEALKEPGDA